MSGVISPEIGRQNSQSLAEQWRAESNKGGSRRDNSGAAGFSINEDLPTEATTANRGEAVAPRSVRSFWSQLLTLCRRNMLLAARSAKLLFLDMFLTLLGAVALGGSHLKADTTGTLYSMYTLSAIVLGITTVIGSTRVLGSGQEVYFREASSGLNRTAHFIAANLVTLCSKILESLFPPTPLIHRLVF